MPANGLALEPKVFDYVEAAAVLDREGPGQFAACLPSTTTASAKIIHSEVKTTGVFRSEAHL